jgi:hypothetical protein
VIFLVIVYLIKITPEYSEEYKTASNNLTPEISYSGETIGDLVTKDTDGDGIPDWEENLWGTDPTKKETTEGIPDKEAVEKMKAAQLSQYSGLTLNNSIDDEESLTQTERLSRGLFSTAGALSQTGSMDQDTIDNITGTLADEIKNQAVQKVFKESDFKIIKSNTKEKDLDVIKKYNSALATISKKYPRGSTVIEILQKSLKDGSTIDPEVLSGLDPIISKTNTVIKELTKVAVPEVMINIHLNLINSLEKIYENVDNIKYYDTDPVKALGAISQYQSNVENLGKSMSDLEDFLRSKGINN